MRFKVNRASYRAKDESPCEGAVFEKYLEEHVVDLSKVEYNYIDKVIEIWKGYGINHRRDGNLLIKDYEHESWWVEINSLEELMDFIEKEGQVVLDRDEIIIYDDYLE